MDDVTNGMGINEHRSLWQTEARDAVGGIEGASAPPAETDVCVVGAGIAGLTTALLLAREGRQVSVIDARPVAAGETGLSTAHLASALDDRFQSLERAHGADGLKLAVEAHAQAIDFIERTCAAESISCGFKRLDGYLFLDPERSPRFLERELEVARRAGLDVEMVDVLPIPTLAPGPALRFAAQGQCDPVRYALGLAEACVERGVTFHFGARAESFHGGETCRLGLADGREIRCNALVVATNTPVNEKVRLHTKQHAYRSYVVALEVEREALPGALFWDTADPYHYVRLQGGEGLASRTDLLIVGGEDHRTGADDDPELRWEALVDWARPRFPAAGPVRHRWSGQVLEPVDGLAFIGKSPDGEENVYVATGDSGHGMTHGTIAGGLLTNLIQGREDPRAALFDPRRWSLRGLPSWVLENLETAAHYLDWATPGHARDEVQLERGQGIVVRRGMKRLAIARDDAGEYRVCSAVCTHLGGIVHWNAAERSWDCPCHGSRFDACGAVLNGPAHRGLETIDPSDAPVLIASSHEAVESAGSMVDLAAPMSMPDDAQAGRLADAPTSSFSGQRSDVSGFRERSDAHESYAQGEGPPKVAPIIQFPGRIARQEEVFMRSDSHHDEEAEQPDERSRLRPTIEPPRSPARVEGEGPTCSSVPTFARSRSPGASPPAPFEGALPAGRMEDASEGRDDVHGLGGMDSASGLDTGHTMGDETHRFEQPGFAFADEDAGELDAGPSDFEAEMPSFASVGQRRDGREDHRRARDSEDERCLASASTTPEGEANAFAFDMNGDEGLFRPEQPATAVDAAQAHDPGPELEPHFESSASERDEWSSLTDDAQSTLETPSRTFARGEPAIAEPSLVGAEDPHEGHDEAIAGDDGDEISASWDGPGEPSGAIDESTAETGALTAIDAPVSEGEPHDARDELLMVGSGASAATFDEPDDARIESGPIDLLAQPKSAEPGARRPIEPRNAVPLAQEDEPLVSLGGSDYDEYDDDDVTTHPSRSQRKGPMGKPPL